MSAATCKTPKTCHSESTEHEDAILRGVWGSVKHRRDEFSMPDDHIHYCCELFYLAQGSCRLFVDDTLFSIVPGGAMLMLPGTLHHMVYAPGSDNMRYSFYFNQSLLEQLESTCGSGCLDTLKGHPVHLDSNACATIESLFKSILAEQDGSDCFSAMLCKNAMLAILAQMARANTPVHRLTPARANSAAADSPWHEAMVQETIHYMLEHFSESLSLEALAARAHISPTYFSKCFKKTTGLGYKEYLIYIRMREARRLLTETDLPVHEISLRCGYPNSNYFGDIFSSSVGMPPRQYRNAARTRLE